MERVEDYAFIWVFNLHTLDLSDNSINYLAKDAFYGLNSLLHLILYGNSLTSIPSDALEVFGKYAPFQYLDLSFNSITELINHDTFSAVSTSLSYLNLEISYKIHIISTKWVGLLQNLKHLTLTCTTPLTCTFLITSNRSLSSLQTIKIINIEIVKFEAPLCTFFPSLKVTGWVSYSYN